MLRWIKWFVHSRQVSPEMRNTIKFMRKSIKEQYGKSVDITYL